MKKLSLIGMLTVSTLLSLTSLSGCATKVVDIPADKKIWFDGTNYIVPQARMLEILDELDKCTQTNSPSR